jgi:hypothetical protein
MSIRKPMYLFGALALLGGTLIAADDDPFVGTWKLDLAKSIYSSNLPKPKELTLTIVDQGGNRLVTFNGTGANGAPIKMELTEPIKGGPIEVRGGPSNPSSLVTVVSEYMSPTAHDFVYSKGGKEVPRRHIEMSEDHQTFTARYTGPDPQGKSITQNDFWRRQ